ncbi:MAG: hypothetical protein QOE00_674 [Ilumatobacteraceae bacterium]|jgi:stage II sporulation protein AA (anti-sigma F factor antagonist)
MEDDGFFVDVEHVDQIATVTVRGEIDLHTAATFHHAFATIEPGTAVVVDLTAVGFMDSTGLHVLLENAAAMANAGGSLHIGGASPQVERLVKITGLDDMMATAPAELI